MNVRPPLPAMGTLRHPEAILFVRRLTVLGPEVDLQGKAAVEGRLPRGFGLKRLVDLPMAWLDQWRALGLQAPTRTRDEPAANSNSGNGNLRSETFGRSRRQWGAETVERTQQTD
jgi:hypothetical protein